jgi:hypothetical protein
MSEPIKRYAVKDVTNPAYVPAGLEYYIVVFADDHDRVVGALQARIDALMLEYCPKEMTEEQLAEWARNQKPEERRCVWVGSEAGPCTNPHTPIFTTPKETK